MWILIQKSGVIDGLWVLRLSFERTENYLISSRNWASLESIVSAARSFIDVSGYDRRMRTWTLVNRRLMVFF